MNAVVEMVRREVANDPAGRAPITVARHHYTQWNPTRGGQVLRDRAWPGRVAAYVIHAGLGLSQSQTAEIIGMTRRGVGHAVAAVEDARDNPAFDALVDRLTEMAVAA